MKITVWLPDDRAELDGAWGALAAHCRRHLSDLVLLPELPFSPWLAADRSYLEDDWRRSAEEHQAWLERLGELGARAVLATAPVERRGERVNQGIAWEVGAGVVTPRPTPS